MAFAESPAQIFSPRSVARQIVRLRLALVSVWPLQSHIFCIALPKFSSCALNTLSASHWRVTVVYNIRIRQAIMGQRYCMWNNFLFGCCEWMDCYSYLLSFLVFPISSLFFPFGLINWWRKRSDIECQRRLRFNLAMHATQWFHFFILNWPLMQSQWDRDTTCRLFWMGETTAHLNGQGVMRGEKMNSYSSSRLVLPPSFMNHIHQKKTTFAMTSA